MPSPWINFLGNFKPCPPTGKEDYYCPPSSLRDCNQAKQDIRSGDEWVARDYQADCAAYRWKGGRRKKKWPLIIEDVEEVDSTSGNRKDWLRPSKLGLQQKNKRHVAKKAHPLSLLPHLRRHWFCRLCPLTRQRVWKAFHYMGYRKRSPYKATTPCPVHNLCRLPMLIHLVRKNWTFFWSTSLHSSIWSFHRLTLINSSRYSRGF